MKSKDPEVTVLMPVYNGERYLNEAMDSILKQSFGDLEFLIINDGSEDGSAGIIKSYDDPRIRLVNNGCNRKLIYTLNRGISLARGDYIARMDCDDISLPERIARQVAFLDAHDKVGICGTWVRSTGETDDVTFKYPTKDAEIRSRLIFESPFAHPSVMMRKASLETSGLLYDEAYPHAEDYGLWQSAMNRFEFANIGDVLLLYRLHDNRICRTKGGEQKRSSDAIRLKQIESLGIEPSAEELEIHQNLSSYVYYETKDFISRADAWLNRLIEANSKSSVYPEPAFSQLLGDRWFEVCYFASGLGAWAWHTFWQSPLGKAAPVTLKQKLLFAVRSGVRYSASK